MFPSVFFWKSATLHCRYPSWGLGGPFIFIKGIGWTCKRKLVQSRCTVRACLRCWVKAQSGVWLLYLGCNNHKGYFIYSNNHIGRGHCGAYVCVSSSVPSFGCELCMASHFTIYYAKQISFIFYKISYIKYKISDILYKILYTYIAYKISYILNKISYM